MREAEAARGEWRGAREGEASTSLADRRTTRKPIDDDCLLDGELHPSIRLRLERVRELPVAAVANLHGVERERGGRPVMVWDFIDGRTLEEAAQGRSREELAALRREVLLAVQSLHAAGIAHGAIHERNVIIDPHGRVRLTHVSPLLYDDPRHDVADAEAIFERLGLPPELHAPSSRTGGAVQRREAARVRSVVGAALVLLIGIAITGSVAWYVLMDG